MPRTLEQCFLERYYSSPQENIHPLHCKNPHEASGGCPLSQNPLPQLQEKKQKYSGNYFFKSKIHLQYPVTSASVYIQYGLTAGLNW